MTTRTMMPVNDKPHTHMNLDTIAREIEQQPYAFAFGGKRFELTHTNALEAFELFAAIELPEPRATIETLKLAMGAEAFNELRSAKPSFGQMQKVIEGYFEHCGFQRGN